MRSRQEEEGSWSADDLLALADSLSDLAPGELAADQLDQLDALERLKSAAAAAQAVISCAFAETAEDETPAVSSRRRTPPRALSIGAEVALAVRTSPYVGEQRVLLSRRLLHDLPETLEALARGELTEDRAFAIAREVEHLHPEQRGRIDAELAPLLAGLGDVELRREVRRLCLTHGADAEERRYRRARADSRVTGRQLDDGTGRLTAVLPIEQMAAVRSVLDEAAAAARAAGDGRTGGQVRADVLVARVTGQDAAVPMPTRVSLVIGADSLLARGTEPGLVQGVGLLPAGLCTDLVRRASREAKATLRRLFVAPEARSLVAMESTSRRFDGLLAEFLDLRDGGTCRTPWCNAAIRHHDHVVGVARDGRTEAANGQGLCERCNYVKETPGWESWVAAPPGTGRHEVHGVTEHLRIVRSTAPPMPGGSARPPDYSPAELVLANHLALAA